MPTAGDEAPTTQPAAIRAWIDQLADPDADVRDEALQSLLGLSPADLPALRDAMRRAAPLLPGQVAALESVVVHVVIQSLPYTPEPGNHPFLGIEMQPSAPTATNAAGGVLITRRLPGFDAFRMLRDRDVIRKVVGFPSATEVSSNEAFRKTIGSFTPGQSITLEIERNGVLKHVSVLLRAQPAAAGMTGVVSSNPNQDEAEQVWTRDFVPLLSNS